MVAKNDRHLRIEVGYGLEGALTDVTTKRIIDEEITPKFKTGDFAGGVSAGVDRMIRVIDGEKLPAPEPPHWREPAACSSEMDLFNPLIIVSALSLSAGILRSMLGRLIGSVATGGVVGVGGMALRRRDRWRGDRRLVAFIIALISDRFHSVRPGRRGSMGGWSGGPAARGRAAVQQRRAAGSAAAAAVLAAAARRGAGSMGIRRIGRHLLEHRWRVRRIFPPQVLAAIEQAIKAGEATHSGQVRFVVEGALDGAPLFRDQPARERALDVFSQLADLGHRAQQRRADLSAAGRPRRRDRRRPRHRRQGRRRGLGKNLPG